MNNIEITSNIIYLENQSDPSLPIHMFSYNIEIENKLDDSIQLLNRHWEITDGNGVVNIVNGKGVVGLQPIIKQMKNFHTQASAPFQLNLVL